MGILDSMSNCSKETNDTMAHHTIFRSKVSIVDHAGVPSVQCYRPIDPLKEYDTKNLDNCDDAGHPVPRNI